MSCGEIDLKCRKCRLSDKRTKVVPGTGPCNARLVLIGEAPGRDEDLSGEPFVGRAGKLLDAALDECGVSRKSVYITNVVKCRPPKNRKPRDEEATTCSEYLFSELEDVKPSVVCILGQTAAKHLLSERRSMSALSKEDFEMIIDGRHVKVFVTFHPAACLYQRKHLKAFKTSIRKSLESAGLA